MKGKKEILKIIILIFIVSVIIIYAIFMHKNETEKFVYYNMIENQNIVDDENIINNTNDILKEEVNKIKVYITGEVKKPGVKELEEGARIEDVINLAGGITDLADISKVNLAYPLEDGQKICIPNVNDKNEVDYISKENENGIIEGIANENSSLININKADVDKLTELPGVGEALAQRIVSYREENGKFKSIEDLKNVSGIGEKKFESLKEYIVVK